VSRTNVVWASDVTYIATSEGWLYLAVILDLCSRRVVGWSMSSRLTTDLVLRAFWMAVGRRKPPQGLMFHSDRGSQYTSKAFCKALERRRMIQSMSRKGNCWDNAPCESFFATLKIELMDGKAFASRRAAQAAIFEYMEVFYNRQRLHSSLGYRTPAEYEEAISRGVSKYHSPRKNARPPSAGARGQCVLNSLLLFLRLDQPVVAVGAAVEHADSHVLGVPEDQEIVM